VTTAAILALSALTLAAIVLSPEYAPDIRRLRRPLARRIPPLREHPVYGRQLDPPADTHMVRRAGDGVITASNGSVTVTAGKHAAGLPRRHASPGPGTEWTSSQPAVRP
jgi:hypothetical protein